MSNDHLRAGVYWIMRDDRPTIRKSYGGVIRRHGSPVRSTCPHPTLGHSTGAEALACAKEYLGWWRRGELAIDPPSACDSPSCPYVKPDAPGTGGEAR